MLNGISSNEIKTFNKGDVIFYEGDNDKELYIITSGEVEIIKNILDDEVVLARLGSGDFFGEMAMFGKKSRSATVRALSDLETIVVREEIFQQQLSNLPDWFGNMIKVLIERIREMNRKIVSQFKYGLGLSILQLLQLVAEHYGTHAGNQISINKDFLIDKIHYISGLAKGIVESHISDFLSANILEIEQETDKLILKNKEQIEQLIEFSLALSTSTDMKSVEKQFPNLNKTDIDDLLSLYKIIRNERSDPLSIVST